MFLFSLHHVYIQLDKMYLLDEGYVASSRVGKITNELKFKGLPYLYLGK